MSVLQILDELAADNSRLAKEAILEREKKNLDFINVIKAAYEPMINYWIKQIPEYNKLSPQYNMRDALKELKVLSSRQKTGNDAIEFLANLLSKCETSTAEVIKRIIAHDLKCGINEATINKIWPGLISTFDVCLAHKDISGIKYPAYAQTKMDGMRCHLVFDGRTATAYTRNGKIIELRGALDSSMKNMKVPEGTVLDGEIVFYNNDKPMDRKTSNGYGNKGVKGTITRDEAEKVRYIVWDVVDFSGTIPYSDRLTKLNFFFENLPGLFEDGTKIMDRIYPCKTTIVNDKDEAMEFYKSCLAAGEEGAILKNMNFVWEAKRVKGMGKLKAEEEADLVVVGWELGSGKNSKRLGNIVCETQDGKLRVNVGTGFKDEDRDQTPDYFLDKIVTIKYNQLIQDKKSKEWTMFLPVFIEIRSDKDVANNFGDLK